MPVAAMAFKLADRQRIKKFIGDDQQGFFRQIRDLLMPVGTGIGAAGKSFLLGAINAGLTSTRWRSQQYSGAIPA